MFSRNKINSQQRGNRGFRNVVIGALTSFVLIGFCVNLAGAYSVKPADEYKEIKAITKSLRKQRKSEDLEKLVEKSRNFVAAHPEYKRVDEVYYLLGNALVQLDRVEDGIQVFEGLIKERPDARYVERCLLELGLAYDKLDKHDAADGAYQKLVNHPKYGSRSQAKLAKKILEQERTERKGELPKPPGAQPAPGMNPREWIGKPALDFHVTDLNGEALSLEQYRGQVVLLDFWATWCPPCIAEIPNVKKTYEKYKDQKFQIVGISLDRSREPLEAYIQKESLTWLHYWDNTGKVSNLYNVQAIPSTFLIDGEGVIRKTNLRGYRLETAVAELVEKNLAKPTDTSTKTPVPKSIPATKLVKPETTPQKEALQKPVRTDPSEWVGKPAPDFQVTDLKGEALSLKDYRGQIVFLDFWATWCGPCIAEMPKIKKTYEKYKDQNFQIIGISLDMAQEPLTTYVEKEGLAWIHYWDESGDLRNLYGVRGIPSAFLVDGEGIIRKASLGGFDVETAVTGKIANLYKVVGIPSTFLIDGEGIIRKTNLRGYRLETAVAELVKENLAKPADASTKTPASKSIPATKLVKPETTPQKEALQKPVRTDPSEWVGKPAPDFQVTDLKGETLSLKDYRGQVVLLDFWATWCGPCIAEMPKIKKTYEKYKDQNFQIIGISLDMAQEPLTTYVEKEGLAWIHYWDESGDLRNLYGVRGIPSAFLVDGEGIIRKASLGGFDVETAVAELVEKNLAQPADTPVSPPSDSPEGAQNTEPNVKEIIDAAIAAHGGLEKLQAVKNIVTESHSFEHFPDGDVQDEGRSKAYFYPDKFRSDWDIDGDVGGLIFDGNSLFRVTERAAKPVPSGEVASYLIFFRDSLFREPIWLLPALAKGDIPVQYAGAEEVKGIPTSVLLVTQPSGKKLKVFISETTHYVVQFSYEVGIGGGVENVVAFFEDYRDVDGVKIAHHRATKNGEYRQILITDIELNAEIDETLFRPGE
jgi:peroxiredoxin